MNDSKKPVSMEDLRKALDLLKVDLDSRFASVKQSELDDKDNFRNFWFRQLQYALVELTGKVVELRYLFSVFQAEHDKQRKQLSELLAKAPKYEQLDNVGGMESYAVQMWGSDVEKWIAEAKELFEAGLENPPLEKETAK